MARAQWAQVPPLVRELRFPKPCSKSKKKEKNYYLLSDGPNLWLL